MRSEGTHRLRHRWVAFDEEIAEVTALIRDVAEQSELCNLALTVPGVVPIVSTARITAAPLWVTLARSSTGGIWLPCPA
jgi:hypothetical protein